MALLAETGKQSPQSIERLFSGNGVLRNFVDHGLNLPQMRLHRHYGCTTDPHLSKLA
jgi:hypothetical protein